MKDLTEVPVQNRRSIIMFVQEYQSLKLKGLYLHSTQNGTGKSSLGVVALKELIRQGKVTRPCYFVDYSILIQSAREAYLETSNFSNSREVERVLDSEVVMIDEFGMNKMTEFVADFLRFLINKLWQDGKSLILTSNVGLDDRLVRALSYNDNALQANAIVSRLNGMCNQIEIKTPDDYRLEFGRE